MKRDIFFVLLGFGSTHRDGALAAVRELCARLLPNELPRGVVVDNALEGLVEIELDAATTCIAGDNSCREFSGWDRGLAWLEAAHAVARDAVVVLCNDTLHRSYGRDYLEGASAGHLSRSLGQRALLGWIDAYPSEIVLFGLPVQEWVRTSLLVASRGVIDRLRPFALPFSDNVIFSDRQGELFHPRAPLSLNYRNYLRTWLFGEAGEADFHERWHSARPLSGPSIEASRGKIRSILCEHYLSARARSLGIGLVDVR